MLEIPGINGDKVEIYGGLFLTLIRKAQKSYEEMMRQQEDCPKDPNHETVIHIISDDEDEQQGYHDSGGEDERGESSAYFHPSPEVEAFNARRTSKTTISLKVSLADKLTVSQTQSLSVPSTARPQAKAQSYKPRDSGGRSQRGSHNGFKSSLKASKGEAGKARSAPYAKKKGASNRSSNSGGYGGIGAMPT